jgi:hypothetical protein
LLHRSRHVNALLGDGFVLSDLAACQCSARRWLRAE